MLIFSRRGGFHSVALPYRSGLEDRLATQLKNQGIDKVYEMYTLSYIIPASKHQYTPDFVLPNGIIIEAKGIFDATDRAKHLLIKKQYPNLDIRFVFSNAKAKIYKGSKTTNAAWCEKYGFIYANREIPAAWFKEPKRDITGLVRKAVKKRGV